MLILASATVNWSILLGIFIGYTIGLLQLVFVARKMMNKEDNNEEDNESGK